MAFLLGINSNRIRTCSKGLGINEDNDDIWMCTGTFNIINLTAHII